MKKKKKKLYILFKQVGQDGLVLLIWEPDKFSLSVQEKQFKNIFKTALVVAILEQF